MTDFTENHPEQKWASAFIDLLGIKKVKDEAVEEAKATLNYYHIDKFDKRYNELVK